MTADFYTNISMIQALANQNGQFTWRDPQSLYMTDSIFNSSNIAQYAQSIAQLAMTGNYTMGMDPLNTSLSTPLWMQNIGNPTQATQFDFTRLYTFNPFAGTTTGTSGATTNPFNPFAPATPQLSELAKELNKYGISSTGNEKKDKEALEKAKQKARRGNEEGADIAGRIFKAVKGSGTDEEALSKAVSEINADNVMAVYDSWKAGSTYANEYGEDDIIGAIQDDCSGSYQTGMEAKIKDALYEKAQNLASQLAQNGLDDDALDLKRAASEFKSTVEYQHHDAMWSTDSTVKEAFDAIVKKIREKEAANIQGASKNNK